MRPILSAISLLSLAAALLPAADDHWALADGEVTAFAFFEGQVHLAGGFSRIRTTLADTPAAGLARWDGAVWRAVPVGAGTVIQNLGVAGGSLFASGDFPARPSAYGTLARLDGAEWSYMADYRPELADVRILAHDGNQMILDRRISISPERHRLLRCTGYEGETLAEFAAQPVTAACDAQRVVVLADNQVGMWQAGAMTWWNAPVGTQLATVALEADGTVVVGGEDVTTTHTMPWCTTTGVVYRRQGDTWQLINQEVLEMMENFRVRSLSVSGGTVYAGGDFVSIDGQPALGLAARSAGVWSAVGGGIPSLVTDAPACHRVRADALGRVAVSLRGEFDGTSADLVCFFNGQTWTDFTAGNTPPSAADVVATVTEDAEVTIALVGSDPDNQPLTYTLVGYPAHGSASQMSGARVLTYRPHADFVGTDTMTYLVNDGLADSTLATITVTVTPVDDAPRISSITVPAGTPSFRLPAALSATVWDDGDPAALRCTWAVERGPGSAVFTPNGTAATQTSAVFSAPGEYQIRLTVSDGVQAYGRSAGVTLASDKTLPALTLVLSDAKMAEPANHGTLQIRADRTAPYPMLVELAWGASLNLDGRNLPQATLGTDLTIGDVAPVGDRIRIIFPAGISRLTVPLRVLDDTGAEGPERGRLILVQRAEYRLGQTTALECTIGDDERPEVRVTIVDGSASELTGDTARVRITRDPPAAWPLTLPMWSGGSATYGLAPADVRALPASVTIAANAASKDVVITANKDLEVEGRRTVLLGFSSTAWVQDPATGAWSEKTLCVPVPGTPFDEVAIPVYDDELPTVSLTVKDAAAAEPADHGLVVVTRQPAVAWPTTVELYSAGTATMDGDVVALPTTVEIPAGATSVNVPVTVIDDAQAEADETVRVALQAFDGTGGNFSGDFEISPEGDEPQPVQVVIRDDEWFAPTEVGALDPGLNWGLYRLDDPAVLPDFSTLAVEAEGVADDLSLGWFLDPILAICESGAAAGAVFDGVVQIAADGRHLIGAESRTTGVRILIDGVEVIHEVQGNGVSTAGPWERSVGLNLRAGAHRLRVETYGIEPYDLCWISASRAPVETWDEILTPTALFHEVPGGDG